MTYERPSGDNTDFAFSDAEYARPSGDTVDFAFGDAVVAETVEFDITGTFPGLQVAAWLIPSIDFDVAVGFPPLSVSMELRYFSNTARPTVGESLSEWQEAPLFQAGATTGQQDSVSHPTGWTPPWRLGEDDRTFVTHPLPDLFVEAYEGWETDFQQASATPISSSLSHQNGDRIVRVAINDAYEAAARIRDWTHFKHQDGDHQKRASLKSYWEVARRLRALSQNSPMSKAAHRTDDWWTRYQDGRRPPIGVSYPPLPPLPPEPSPCYTPSGHLVFKAPWSADTNFVFICDGYVPPPPTDEPVIVPIKRVYIVLNTTSLRRVSDNALVPTISMSLSLDVDSWSWSFSASLPGAAQSLVEPTTGPVELKALVNGTEFRVLAESVSRERVFGQTSIRVSGRGRNAVLDAPYVPSLTFGNSESRTAQQLMGDVLTFNGIPLGWAINWQLTDWVVPAGVFNHQGSYISALNAIVGAAGGYLLPHPSAMSFTVKHRYPTAPWNWASVTPDFELPAAVTTRESLEWREKPVYNRVYVSGQQNGILGRVTRATTDGALLAPMVVDPLVTAVDAARQRGRAILSDTGRQIGVGLRLPVLAETGVIQPGAFVEYVDGGTTRLGLVRGTSIEIDHPDVWQTLEVETHE